MTPQRGAYADLAGPESEGMRGLVYPRSLRVSGIQTESPRTLKGAILRSMLDITKDIQSLTTFRRQSGDFMKQIKKSKRPVVLTVNGKAAAVVQDAEAYQRLLDIAAGADAAEGIRQGLEDVRKRRIRPAKEFFKEFEARHGLSR